MVIPFDQIMTEVQNGSVDAGLIIHEGQLTYASQQLHKIVDLGEWWYQCTRLPLPLGGNVVRRDLGMEDIREISRLLKESIQYALDHREEALNHAMQFARDLDTKTADRFVGMYVNERTLDYGTEGRQAVQQLFDRAFEAKIIPRAIRAEFADSSPHYHEGSSEAGNGRGCKARDGRIPQCVLDSTSRNPTKRNATTCPDPPRSEAS